VADIQGDRARARCAVTAIHRIGRNQWTPGGHYEMELLHASHVWTICAITYHNVLVVGDETLPGQAQARARSMT